MTYDFAQYHADRKLLLFRSNKARLDPDVLDMKLALALSMADAGDHEAIQAAYARLVAIMEKGPDAIPQPPEDAGEGAAAAGQGGPRIVPDRAAEPPRKSVRLSVVPPDPGQVHAPSDAEAIWADALAAQAERHVRRRSGWPAVAPRQV